MDKFDLCFAWEWPYDRDFVNLLEAACQNQRVSLLQVTPENLDGVLKDLFLKKVDFLAFFDRASDTNSRFVTLVDWAREISPLRINPYGLARRAWNKANNHILFSSAGLPTPEAIVLPSYYEQPELVPQDISCLGPTFSIKPAHGGGGQGVRVEAKTWEEILAARREFPADQYLVQAHITTQQLDGREAWFRVLYCGGEVYPCWWDTRTHVYSPVTEAEENHLSLEPLREMTSQISSISGLDLFSTEFALSTTGEMVVVDYLNDPIDLRLQSNTYEGVPDGIACSIANRIAGMVIETRASEPWAGDQATVEPPHRAG